SSTNRRASSATRRRLETTASRAGCRPRVRARPRSTFASSWGILPGVPSLLEGVDDLPVVLHVRDDPSESRCVVEGPGEAPDRRLAVVGPFAGRVGVVDDQAEPGAGPCGGPAEHLVIAVGVAERGDRAPADPPLDAHGLPRAVVDELDLGQADEHRLVVPDLV